MDIWSEFRRFLEEMEDDYLYIGIKELFTEVQDEPKKEKQCFIKFVK